MYKNKRRKLSLYVITDKYTALLQECKTFFLKSHLKKVAY